MRGRAGTITRAALFLLFAIVLAALATPQASAEAAASLRGGTAESKKESCERRDSEKPQERSPGVVLSRRTQHIHARLRRLLPRLWNCVPRTRRSPSRRAVAHCPPENEYARSRHSPASLQIFRH
jgi:hypothetical protein